MDRSYKSFVASISLKDRSPYHSPPLNFEKATGIEGVAHIYRFPKHISSVGIDDEIKGGRSERGRRCRLLTAFITTRGNVEDPDFQAELLKSHGELLSLYNEIRALNPELVNVYTIKTFPESPYLNIQSFLSLRDTIHGVASFINPRDIEFGAHRFQKLTVQEANEHRAKIAELGKTVGTQLEWIPSDYTMRHIKRVHEKRTSGPSTLRPTLTRSPSSSPAPKHLRKR